MAINKIIYDVSGEEVVDSSGNVTVYSLDGTANKVNKVVFGEQVLMDITDTTATASEVLSGYVVYGADGLKVVGTADQTINASGGEVDDDTLIIGSGGGGTITITDEANSTGITCAITTGGSPTP